MKHDENIVSFTHRLCLIRMPLLSLRSELLTPFFFSLFVFVVCQLTSTVVDDHYYRFLVSARLHRLEMRKSWFLGLPAMFSCC